MKVNPFVYGLLVIGIFMGIIMSAQQFGFWSVSGKVDSEGQTVEPSSADANSIKGWMTLEQISTTFGVPVSEMLSAFSLPADTASSTALKDLESDQFSITALRSWLKERTSAP